MRIPRSNLSLFVLNIAICLAIFFIDLKIASGIDMSIPYITCIMLSLWLPGTRHTIDFAFLCSMLTVLGFYLSPENVALSYAITNRMLSIFAIWATTSIAIYHKNAALRVEYSEHRKQAILSSSLEPIIILDSQHNIQSVSLSITTFFQWQPQELIGKEIYTLLAEPFKTQYRQALTSSCVEQQDIINNTKEILGERKDQSTFPCEISVRKVTLTDAEHDETIFTIILRDIHERKENEEKLIWLSSHDGLTGIFNRRYFNETIEKEWQRLARNKSSLALVIIDIDHFKKYNDILGHQAGDNCLQQVAATLQKCINRPGDFVARYGGEEFVVLLPNTDANGAHNMAQKIHQEIKTLSLAHPYPSLGSIVSISIGVSAAIPNSHNSTEFLIKQADNALYQAKDNGRNCIVVADNIPSV